MSKKREAFRALTKERIYEALKPSNTTHPVLSAMLFSHATATKGGASMDVNTGNIATPKDDLHFVGGEKDVKGKRIKTKMIDKGKASPGVTIAQALQHRMRIQKATGGQKSVNMGSWVNQDNPKEGVYIDASRGYTDLGEAKKTMESRNEMALFSMKKGEIKNKKYDPNKKQT